MVSFAGDDSVTAVVSRFFMRRKGPFDRKEKKPPSNLRHLARVFRKKTIRTADLQPPFSKTNQL
jgi:hypothetical protein